VEEQPEGSGGLEFDLLYGVKHPFEIPTGTPVQTW